MNNELALAIDFYMWLSVTLLFILVLSILGAENARLRKKSNQLEQSRLCQKCLSLLRGDKS